MSGSTLFSCPYSYHQNCFLTSWVRNCFLPAGSAKWEPVFLLCGWFLSHKQIAIYFSWSRDGLFRITHMGIPDRDIAFCFTPPQNGGPDHKFTVGTWTAFYFSIITQKEERERKKISLHNVVLGTKHFPKVYMGTILLYGSLAESLKQECSEGENINWSAIMKFHCIWFSQEM